ncbi:MAG: chromate transporter [Clostridiales bacterium]|nr:chromate transporter [Clostridiales bacterium]
MRTKLFQLFLTFFRIGLFTFGGGYAMIPLIQRETVERRKWISDDDILEVIAIAESTPGPIAINSATFIGYKVAGVWGAVCATLGTVLPSFIIILIISFFLRQFQDIKAVQYAFNGIRAGVLALVIKAWWTMAKKMPKNSIAYIIAIGAFLAAGILDIHVLLVIVCSGIIGLIASLINEGRTKK